MSLAIPGGARRFQGLAFSRPALPSLDEIKDSVAGMLESGMVTKGPQLVRYEAALAEYTGARRCLGVSSCTLGLMLVLQALGGEGEVVVPSYSFCASFTAPRWNGAGLRFVECDAETWTVDTHAVDEALTFGGVRAVVATYIFGNPPDLDALEVICHKHGVPLVLDAAHAFGSLYHGVQPGRRGDAEVFSTSATKLLATGEGGVVSTGREDIARHIEVGREYGNPGNYDCLFPGLNARLSEFHATLGTWSLARLEDTANRRNQIASLYRSHLAGVPGVQFQKIRDDCRSSCKDFAILIDSQSFGLSRDQVVQALAAEGIPTRNYFDPPGHRQTAFKRSMDLPVTDRISRQVICLPIHTRLEDAQVSGIAETIQTLQRTAGEVSARLSAGDA